jgi:hypothetical protein
MPTGRVSLSAAVSVIAYHLLDRTDSRHSDIVILEAIPTVVQIYSFLSDSSTSLPPSVNFIAAILFERSVRQIKWNPKRTRKLAVCTFADDARQPSGGAGIYFWDGEWEEEDSFADADGAKQGVVEAMLLPTRKWLRLSCSPRAFVDLGVVLPVE